MGLRTISLASADGVAAFYVPIAAVASGISHSHHWREYSVSAVLMSVIGGTTTTVGTARQIQLDARFTF